MNENSSLILHCENKFSLFILDFDKVPNIIISNSDIKSFFLLFIGFFLQSRNKGFSF